MIVTTARQYLDVPRGQLVTLFNFGDTLYVGDQTVSAGVNESTVLNGATVTLTAGRYLVSAGWSRVEEDITPLPAASDSLNVRAYGAVGDGTAEPATPFQSAYLAATVTGQPVFIPKGTYYINDALSASVFQIARDNARTGPKVQIVFDPGAVIKLSALTPRLVDFNKVADWDWFRNIEFVGNGATIDANNIGGRHHVLIGCWINGTIQARINYERIYVRGLRVINVYTDATDGSTNQRHGAWLSPLGDAAHDSYGNFVEFTDIDITGGHGGITIGNAGAGSLFHWDRVYIRRCRHDRGLITETFGGADGFYIGSRGVGGQGGFEDCYSRGAADTAYEINGAAEGFARNCVAVDPANNGFLHRGANGGIDPADPAANTVYADCETRKIERTGAMRHLKFGVDTAGDYDAGVVRVRGGGCSFERTDSADISTIVASSPNNYRMIDFDGHDIVIKAGPSSANTTGSALVTTAIGTDRGNGGIFKMRNVTVRLEGAVDVGAGLSRRTVDLRGTWLFDGDNINIQDVQTFTSGTPTLRCYAIGLSLNADGVTKSAVWGRITRSRCAGGTASATAVDYGAFATQAQAVAGRRFVVDSLDCSELAAGSVPVNTSGASLKDLVARNIVPRGTFAFPTVAASATVALPAYDVEGAYHTVTGNTGVTLITASWPGRIVRLNVTGTPTFTDNGTTLNLAGDFVGPGLLTGIFDASGNFNEVSRRAAI